MCRTAQQHSHSRQQDKQTKRGSEVLENSYKRVKKRDLPAESGGKTDEFAQQKFRGEHL